jgi:hypothetical protein
VKNVRRKESYSQVSARLWEEYSLLEQTVTDDEPWVFQTIHKQNGKVSEAGRARMLKQKST